MWLHHFTFPPAVCKGPDFSISLLSYFLIAAILVRMKCCLIVVLIWISPLANDVEHVFICLLVTWVSSLEKCLLEFFAIFGLGFVFFFSFIF